MADLSVLMDIRVSIALRRQAWHAFSSNQVRRPCQTGQLLCLCTKQRYVKLLLIPLLISVFFVAPAKSQTAPAHSPLEDIPLLSWLTGTEVDPGTGIAPHAKFRDTYYRVTGSFGINVGLVNDAPTVGALFGSYQIGHDVLSGGFLTSNSNGRLRKTWIEGELLYGYAWNGYDFGYFSKGATGLWVMASAGLAFDTYDIRYRRFSRFDPQPPIDTTLPPNSFQYAIGLPIQIEASYAITHYLGVSATIFANFNKIQITYGAMAGLQIGWF